jgi:hypothetical protein
MTLMAETIANDRRPSRAAVSRSRSAKPMTVSASALALHLDCGRTYIHKLESEGVLTRLDGGGFPLDQNRVAYLRYLRRERKHSPRTEADAEFQRAKTELMRIRVAEKKKELIPFDDALAQLDEVVGLFLTHLGGLSARCGGHDLAVRRAIDKAVFEMRVEIAKAARKLADGYRNVEVGEPEEDI